MLDYLKYKYTYIKLHCQYICIYYITLLNQEKKESIKKHHGENVSLR